MQKEIEKKEAPKVPFFVRFLEKQGTQKGADRKEPGVTQKYPSDFDDT